MISGASKETPELATLTEWGAVSGEDVIYWQSFRRTERLINSYSMFLSVALDF